MNARQLTRRMALILFIMAALAVLAAARLVRLQVVEGEEYLERSQSAIYVTEELPAVRGCVYDRYGVPLITNSVTYSLTLTKNFVAEDDIANPTLVTLIDILKGAGEPYADDLPISLSAPFEFTDGSAARTDWFSQFAEARGWEENISASETLEKLRKRYCLSEEYSDAEARLIVGVRYSLELRKTINIDPYLFAENVSVDTVAKVLERGCENVSVLTSGRRVYNTGYAAHLLGYLGQMTPEDYEKYGPLGYDMNELVGRSGVEAAFEEYLHGEGGSVTRTVDKNGSVTGVVSIDEPQPGDDVYLTLDLGLQAVAEESLESTILKLRANSGAAEGGAAVVMDVKNAEILAMASYPTFDLSNFTENYTALLGDKYNPLLNRAAQGTYEPGSTFKMVTATAALQTGAINKFTEITDNGIYTYYADSNYTPACWIYTSTGATHGTINVMQALSVSCNCFFYEAGRLTGAEKITDFARAYGLGEATGFELDESLGHTAYSGPEGWMPGYTLQISIGQQSLYTPLQLANYVATVANGGTRYSAHLLRGVTTADGEGVVAAEAKAEKKISASDYVLETIQAGMELCASEGTGSAAFEGFGVSVAAKTGSAQTGNATDNGVFVCYAPADDPEIAVAVVVEKGGQGSLVAEIARDILEYYFSDAHVSDVEEENTLLK